MRKYYFTDKTGATWERITKTTALKKWMHGEKIIIIPENFRPFTPWGVEYITTRESRKEYHADETGARNDFTNLVNSFIYYNCVNTETGKKPAFYSIMK